MLSVTPGEAMDSPELAVIVVLPLTRLVANPGEPDALLMVATDAVVEFHVTADVISEVEPSEYEPTA
jgi:hypothetical protein